jgi:PRTRC genetic system protein F
VLSRYQKASSVSPFFAAMRNNTKGVVMHNIQAELNAVMTTFQLPQLHPDIPITPTISAHECDDSSLAANLLKARVIDPNDIPETAESPIDILRYGLQAWFNRRSEGLEILNFEMALLDHQSMQNLASTFNDSDRKFDEPYTLVIYGCSEDTYVLEARSTEMEIAFPGLFAVALGAIQKASSRTINIRTPHEVFAQFACWHWDGDENPSESDARELLLERFGETDEIENYMPKTITPIFGGSLCIHYFSNEEKRKLQTIAGLKKFVQQFPDDPEAKVALQTITLLRAIAKADKANAQLPDMHDIYADSIIRGCNLVFRPDVRVWQTIDSVIEDAYNAGDATEILGLQSLPKGVDELRRYFSKLDLAFTVVRHMDKLISMISTKYTS